MKGGTQRRGMLAKAFVGVAALLGMGFGAPTPSNNAAAASQQRSIGKDAINKVEAVSPRTVRRSQLNGAGDSNPYKHNRKGLMNQKQMRKKLASNPSLRKSKKSPLRKKR